MINNAEVGWGERVVAGCGIGSNIFKHAEIKLRYRNAILWFGED